MYCRKCGTLNDDNAYKCVKCLAIRQGAEQTLDYPSQRIPSYLAQAIIVTLLCCMPFGIPAIVYASQVNAKVHMGNIEGALESSRKARMWCWVSFGFGLTFTVLYVLVSIGIGAVRM